MPQQRGPWCAECGQEKGATNHWMKLIETPSVFVLWPADAGLPVDMIEDKVLDICGQNCASKRQARWMDSVKQAATPAAQKGSDDAL